MTKQTAAQRTMQKLREELLDGKIAPGTWLREEEMALRLGVGRYTVRTAIELLVNSGLIVHETNRGAFVAPISVERVNELYDFRRIIELGALRTVLEENRSIEIIEKAESALHALEPDAPWHQVIDVHNDLHRSIVLAAGNQRLLNAYDGYQDELRFMLAFLGAAHSIKIFIEFHDGLVDLIRSGDSEALKRLDYDLTIFGAQSLILALENLA